MPGKPFRVNPNFDDHLGLDRRGTGIYTPKYTHRELDSIGDELRNKLDEVGSDVGIIDLGDGQVVTGYSKPYLPLSQTTLYVVYGNLSVAGSTDTVAEVNQNGVAMATLTIPASSTLASVTVSLPFEAEDRWQMNVTSAGSGALGLTFYGRFA